jgi:hypothetical protein
VAFDRLLGEAYILMRADGTLIPRDVKASGAKAAKGYAKSFNKELKAAEKGSLARFRKSLAQSTADIDFSRFRKEFGTVEKTVAGITKRVRQMKDDNLLTAKSAKAVRKAVKEWGAEQERVAASTRKSADAQKALVQYFKDQKGALASLRTAQTAAAKQRESDTKKSLTQFFRDQEEGFARLEKARLAKLSQGQRRLTADVVDFGRALDGVNKKQWRTYVNTLAEAQSTGDFSKFRKDTESLALTTDRFRGDLDKFRSTLRLTDRQVQQIRDSYNEWHDTTRDLERQQRLLNDAAAGGGDNDVIVRRFGAYRDSIDDVNHRLDRYADLTGRAFGRGSRNNFLNLIGAFVSGFVKLTLVLPIKALGLAAKAVGSFMEGFSKARAEGLGFFTSVVRGLTGALGGPGGLLKLALGTVAALYAFGKLLPGLISLISLLAGAATALVGSISIGIVGGLLALIPVLAASAVGFAALGFAIAEFAKDKSNKKLIDGLKDDWKDFNKEIQPEMKEFFTFVVSGFDEMLDDIRPGVETFLTEFRKKLSDKSSLAGLNAISDSFGRIFDSVARATASLASGLVGFFQPVLPYAERLATYIENVFARFDTWANSEPGRNSIAEFMLKAWIAAGRVKDIIVTIGEIIGKVFMSGNDNAGDFFLSGIQTKLNELSTFLSTEAGKKKLDEWFRDAKQIGKDVGSIAVSIGNIIRELNSPEGRASAKGYMDTFKSIADAAEAVAGVADSVGDIVDAFNTPISTQWARLFGLGGATPKPEKPQTIASEEKRQNAPPVFQQGSVRQQLSEYLVKVNVDDKLYQEKVQAIQAFQMNGKTITIKGNEALWQSVKNTAAAYVFTPKQIPVEGNTTEWDKTKGTVAGYVFDSKTVQINANADPVKSAVDNVRRWLNSLPNSKTIRIAGVNATGGLTMATGGTVYGPTRALIGEAGPEAVVPLRRNLNQVDPSVRALSAIAQGMKIPALAGGGIAGVSGGGPTVVEEGAVKVYTQASDPNVVARVVLNGLGDALAGI